MRRLYRCRFQIDASGPNERERLSAVTEACRRWALRHREFNQADKAHVDWPIEEDLNLQVKDSVLETVWVSHEGRAEWALRYSHPDSSDHIVRWTVEIAVREDHSKNLDLRCLVAIALVGDQISPINRATKPPRIVRELIESFPCRSGLTLKASPSLLGEAEIKEFVGAVKGGSRYKPIVLNSVRDLAGKTIVDSKRLASDLTGIAHVFETANRFITRDLKREGIPNRYLCWNGGVRIFWPEFSPSDNVAKHNLWTAKYLERLQPGIAESQIVSAIAQAAAVQASEDEPSWERIEEARRQRRIEELHEKISSRAADEEYRELYEMQEELLDLRRKETEELELRVSSLREDLSRERLDNENLRVQLRAYIKQGAVEDEEEERSLSSLQDAVEEAEKQYAQELVFKLNSRSSVVGNPFERPEEAYEALSFLADTYCRSKRGDISVTDFDKELRERCGWQYRSSQSPITMKRWPEDYTTTWNGRKYWLGSHLASRSTKDPRYSLRIAFDWDSESQKVVVGFIGQHQRTSAT